MFIYYTNFHNKYRLFRIASILSTVKLIFRLRTAAATVLFTATASVSSCIPKVTSRCVFQFILKDYVVKVLNC